ncbi:thioredoxin domain-containing protein [Candidatus Poribacteria bacterium]|nr:thioredoxin domain-containing protein [Candidatus Poribacteria bacterium]
MYEAGFDPRHLRAAIELPDTMLEHFLDAGSGGLFLTADDGEKLLTRSKDIHDGALPSGNSVAACNLLRLAHMTGRVEYADQARGIIAAFSGRVFQLPTAHAQLLQAVDFLLGPAQEIVILGESGTEEAAALAGAVRSRFVPRAVLTHCPREDTLDIPRFASLRRAIPEAGQAVALVCQDSACQPPVSTPEDLAAILPDPARNKSGSTQSKG